MKFSARLTETHWLSACTGALGDHGLPRPTTNFNIGRPGPIEAACPHPATAQHPTHNLGGKLWENRTRKYVPVHEPVDPGSSGRCSWRDMATACDLSAWRLATLDNTIERRVVVVDAWSHVGIGHTIRASALWLRLVSISNASRTLKFASCVPSRLTASFSHSEHAVPACDARVFDERTHRNVSAAAYDLHRDLTFAGLPSMSANEYDFRSLRTGWAPRPVDDCAALHRRLRKPQMLVVLYGLNLRDMVLRCVRELRPRQPLPFACLKHVHLTPPAQPLPACDVGLHLRSMKLDDHHCELLTGEGHASGRGGGDDSCMFEWRQRRCKDTAFPQVIAGCPGRSRYATADVPALYPRTRAVGWADLNEEASITWSACL